MADVSPWSVAAAAVCVIVVIIVGEIWCRHRDTGGDDQ